MLLFAQKRTAALSMDGGKKESCSISWANIPHAPSKRYLRSVTCAVTSLRSEFR
jgi:hypothetical protein